MGATKACGPDALHPGLGFYKLFWGPEKIEGPQGLTGKRSPCRALLLLSVSYSLGRGDSGTRLRFGVHVGVLVEVWLGDRLGSRSTD